MKKIFHLQHEKKHPDRIIEAIKYEIRKYLKRERGKKLPEGAIFWDFDCRFGQNSDVAERLESSHINKALDQARKEEWDVCYVEILAKAAYKTAASTSEI